MIKRKNKDDYSGKEKKSKKEKSLNLKLKNIIKDEEYLHHNTSLSSSLGQQETKINYIKDNDNTCTHEVIYPINTQKVMEYEVRDKDADLDPSSKISLIRKQLPPPQIKEMAMDFSFELDPFQNISIRCLEAGKLNSIKIK